MSLHVIICRYIFFADKVEIEDITERTSLFVLIGPNSNHVRLLTIYSFTFLFYFSFFSTMRTVILIS